MSREVFFEGKDGNRLHCSDWGGAGTPVLLVHGMGGHTHWWDDVAAFLKEEYRVVALDFRGHGESAWTEPPRYQILDYVADIEDARRRFGWERFYLVGHSLGARACLHYAKRHGERLGALAALDFLAAYDEKRHAKYETRMKRRQPSYATPDPMVKNFRLQPRGTSLGRDALERLARLSLRRRDDGRWTWKFDWRAFYFEYSPIWNDVRGLTTPCLVMRGELSVVMPRASFKKTVSALTRAEGVEIAGTHHHIPLEAPEGVARALVEFGRRNFARMKA